MKRARRISRALIAAGVAGAVGCAAPGPAVRQAWAPTPTAAAAPVGYVNGDPVALTELAPLLIEAGGGDAMTELVLNRQLRRRLADRGWAVGDDAVERERDLLARTLSDDPDEAARLLAELRRERGLGPVRFEQLLWRNAALRRLVRDQVTVPEPSVRQAYELSYGPRYQVRLIVAPSLDAAAALRRRAAAGASFADLAVEHSIDASAPRGGLLPPISPVDPAYPAAVRQALPELERRDPPLSDVIAVESGYALLRLERKIGASGTPFDDVKEQLAREVRLRFERAQMQQMARVLIREARVVVTDGSLQPVWERQREQILAP